MFDGVSSAKLDILTQATYNIVFCNDIFCCLEVDAYPIVRDSGLYRHEVKHWMKELRKARQMYERKMREIISAEHGEHFMDMNDRYAEVFQEDLDEFLSVIKESLAPHVGKDLDAMAHIVRLRTIIEVCVELYKERMNDIHRLSRSFSWIRLEYLDMSDVLAKVERIAQYVGYYDIEADTTKGQEILERIEHKLAEGKHIKNAIE